MPTFKDQWFLTKDNGIVKFSSAKKSSHSISVVGVRFVSVSELVSIPADENLSSPFSSAEIHVLKLQENAPSLMVEVPWTEIRCKLVAVRLPSDSLNPVSINPIASYPNSYTIAST